MSSKAFIKKYPSLGEVSFNRNLRYKRLSIKIDRTGKISVNIPFFITFSAAEQFLLSNKDTITNKKDDIISRHKSTIKQSVTTKLHELKLIPHQNFEVKRSNNIIEFYYPANLAVESDEVQQKAEKILDEIYRAEAKIILPRRIAEIAQSNGFKYNKVTIRNTKSRWGSCSNCNNINLSLQLLKLPEHLIDYIILHELCHTVEKNHGKGFWTLLDSKCNGKAKMLAKEVRQCALNL